MKSSHTADTFFGPRLRTLRESGFWVLAGVSIILLLALESYSPSDPAYSITSGDGDIANRMGALGAWFADISFFVFGLPSYLFPVLVLLAGIHLYRYVDENLSGRLIALRGSGYALTIATSAGLASLHFDPGLLRESAGGVLGQLIGGGLQMLLGMLGATVMLLVLWLAAVSLATGVSWISAMDFIGHQVLRGATQVGRGVQWVRDWSEGRRARQERHEMVVLSREKAKTKTAKRRIEPSLGRLGASERAEREKQVTMFEPPKATELPPLALLDDPPPAIGGFSPDALEAMSRLVELKLGDFGIEAEVVGVHPGPVITRFELKPAAGVKVSQISNLAKDLARSLSTVSVRVVEIIPGKPYVGLEIPNEVRELVSFGEIVKSEAYDSISTPLALALGKSISGEPVVADLARMPHLLIAGTTGSGKSVAINAMVLSLLYKSTPEHVRMIMIDPKMLELSVYEGIPHLLAPVVTDMQEAANALRWCVAEMDRRYSLMASLGVRQLAGYNRKVAEAIDRGEPLIDPNFQTEDPQESPPPLEPLPNIVVIIDELADMMMLVGKKCEELIARLAQKARASGIHMLIATQRPSVDVITGLIKANIPTRIAFQVSAKVDSRTILDQIGAEHLLGHGDMLYLPTGSSLPERVHGAFVSDQEVHAVVRSLRESGAPSYIDDIVRSSDAAAGGTGADGLPSLDAEQDPLYDQAVRIVTETRKASISGIQRRLKIGYNRAARMVETMEQVGIVGELQANGSREVLVPPPPGDD